MGRKRDEEPLPHGYIYCELTELKLGKRYNRIVFEFL